MNNVICPLEKCSWTTPVEVKIAAHLSRRGKDTWSIKPIDGCIADIVRALSHHGIVMLSSCCGHGLTDGKIVLHDGRIIKIAKADGEGGGG